MLATREFLLIMGLGFIVAGLTAYVIVWMLVAVHLRDHHPAVRKTDQSLFLVDHPDGAAPIGCN